MDSIIAKVIFSSPDYETGQSEPLGFLVATEDEVRMHTLNGEVLYRASWEGWWAQHQLAEQGGMSRAP